MPMLSELEEYKRKIVNLLVNDRELVDLVSCRNDLELPAKSLVNNNIFLYDFVDETVKDQKVFICIEVDEGDYINPQARYYDVHIYVVIHKRLMSFIDDNGRGGVRRDAICERIDHILNGRTDIGFDKVTAAWGQRLVYAEDFRAKDLHYKVKGWNLRGDALDKH